MHAEQFRIINNGKGYRVAKSPDVDNWLDVYSYISVAHQKGKPNTETEVEKWLDTKQVYARSLIHMSIDDLDRSIFRNHTILVRYRDAAELGVRNIPFHKYFKNAPSDTVKVLPTIKLK